MGRHFTVHGNFVPGMNTPWSASEHNPTLRSHDSTFVPVTTSQHELNKAWVPTDLSSEKCVFIRHDAHRGLLKPPWSIQGSGVLRFVIDVVQNVSQLNTLNQLTDTWIS